MDIKNKQNDPALKGQGSSLDNGNNPKGVSSLKESRKTGEIKQGTAFLRGEQMGHNK
jgi:hypothetical protein